MFRWSSEEQRKNRGSAMIDVDEYLSMRCWRAGPIREVLGLKSSRFWLQRSTVDECRTSAFNIQHTPTRFESELLDAPLDPSLKLHSKNGRGPNGSPFASNPLEELDLRTSFRTAQLKFTGEFLTRPHDSILDTTCFRRPRWQPWNLQKTLSLPPIYLRARGPRTANVEI